MVTLSLVAALAALAAWPAYLRHIGTDADPIVTATPAPLRDDESIRRETIAFEERRVARDADDQITPRMLAASYLQRYRERGDVGDVLRAEAMARRSLRVQPRRNVAALDALAEALLALHRFREARAAVRRARTWSADEPALAMQEASLDLELGELGAARALVARFGNGRTQESEVEAARIDEVTGRLADARRLLRLASRRVDAIYDAPAERRAWFHVRLGEMAFNAGAIDEAIDEERTALARFPADAKAWTDIARFSSARGAWDVAADAATRAAALIPSPENLGLLADAQDALGRHAAAAASRDEIEAVARIGNSARLVDRLLANYDADHGVHLASAYAMARREIKVRDDVFAEDTLAWTAACSGRWREAAVASRKAMATGIEDARIRYHAAVIAEHEGDYAAAMSSYRSALALNPQFDAVFAPKARARLSGAVAGARVLEVRYR